MKLKQQNQINPSNSKEEELYWECDKGHNHSLDEFCCEESDTFCDDFSVTLPYSLKKKRGASYDK